MKHLTPQARFDAVSYFLDQELEAKDPRKFAQLVPGIVGRRILSNVQGLTRSQPVYSYEMQTLKAKTKRGAPKAKDAHTVEVVREKVTHQIEEYPASMEWHLDEVENARINGRNLPDDKRLAAVTKLEEAIDKSLAVGDGANVTGLLNNANVNDSTAGAKTGGGAAWTVAGATADEMVLDVTTAVATIEARATQVRIPGVDMPAFNQWCLILPTTWYVKAASKYRANTDSTALDLIQRLPFIKSVVPWWRANTADATAVRAMLVPALDTGAINPMAAGAIVPFDYEQTAPQLVGFNTVVPCRAKAGGVAMPYPVMCEYIDIT
jgi:hypothetical protein